jgi:hypothetical protein
MLPLLALLMLLPSQSADAGVSRHVHRPEAASRHRSKQNALGGLRFGSGGDLPFTPDNYPRGSKERP